MKNTTPYLAIKIILMTTGLLLISACETVTAPITSTTPAPTNAPTNSNNNSVDSFNIAAPADMQQIYAGSAKSDGSAQTYILTNQGTTVKNAHKKLYIIEKKGLGEFKPASKVYSDDSCYVIQDLASQNVNLQRKQNIVLCGNYKQRNHGFIAISLGQQGREKFYSMLYTQKLPVFTNSVQTIKQLPLNTQNINELTTLLRDTKITQKR